MAHELTRDWPHGYQITGNLRDGGTLDVTVLTWDRPVQNGQSIIAMDKFGTTYDAWPDGRCGGPGGGPDCRLHNKPAPKLTGTVTVAIVQNRDDPKDVRPTVLFKGASREHLSDHYWKTLAQIDVPWAEGQGLPDGAAGYDAAVAKGALA